MFTKRGFGGYRQSSGYAADRETDRRYLTGNAGRKLNAKAGRHSLHLNASPRYFALRRNHTHHHSSQHLGFPKT